jgi:tRNA pseudouridine55 synthase
MDPNAPAQNQFQKGKLMLVDKPVNWTSFDLVNKIRLAITRTYKIKKIKVGHAGTLDPLATGLVIVCSGKATKTISELSLLTKEYTGTFVLGATTPSYDLEKEIDKRYSYEFITEEMIYATAQKFLGEQEQIPPVFSAIQVKGKRAYNYAREGEKIELKSRKIHIFEFDILNINLPNVDFRLKVSKGTYIRSIARDFGLQLNSGAYLTNLRRTKIGDYDISNALTVNNIISIIESSTD